MEAKIELINPDTATEMLQSFRGGRAVNRRMVDYYAMQMRRGNWTINGDPITFDTEGALLNGLTRLHAVVISDTEQTFLVVRDVHVFQCFRCGQLNYGRDRTCTNCGCEDTP